MTNPGKRIQIGVTGGIGSGKSLVCRIFSVLGIPIYDADTHARDLMVTDKLLISEISREFGNAAYDNKGNINRPYISKAVFGNEERLKKLNALVHPRLHDDFHNWVLRFEDLPYVIKEAALIFEAGSWQGLDKVIVVTAPEDIRMRRVLQRDRQRTEVDVLKIVASQMPEEEKVRRADFIIQNDDRAPVIPQVLAIDKQLRLLKREQA